MSIEWKQTEEFYANQDGYFIRVGPIVHGPGYTVHMGYLGQQGHVETIPVGHGLAYDTVDEAKAAAEGFFAAYLATPATSRQEFLKNLRTCEPVDDPYIPKNYKAPR
jgi:hypothetical protein